ncbi:MAG: helix-turn-helix transcriptional regulator [Clostridia bacterium]|nr:helix-turn-helix transcriptional regulator [Clostridia bacterium]
MLFKEAVSQRVFELCDRYNYTPNKLAELSAIPPSTLRALLANQVENPSATVIFKICKTLKIELKDFYNSKLFDMNKLEY